MSLRLASFAGYWDIYFTMGTVTHVHTLKPQPDKSVKHPQCKMLTFIF